MASRSEPKESHTCNPGRTCRHRVVGGSRRSVKAEAAFLAERAETAAYAFDSAPLNRVSAAIARADVDVVAAVSLLEFDAHGSTA